MAACFASFLRASIGLVASLGKLLFVLCCTRQQFLYLAFN